MCDQSCLLSHISSAGSSDIQEDHLWSCKQKGQSPCQDAGHRWLILLPSPPCVQRQMYQSLLESVPMLKTLEVSVSIIIIGVEPFSGGWNDVLCQFVCQFVSLSVSFSVSLPQFLSGLCPTILNYILIEKAIKLRNYVSMARAMARLWPSSHLASFGWSLSPANLVEKSLNVCLYIVSCACIRNS